ncbi:MAG: hypothetical protein HOP30_06815 [Cyclobacteriaceae bacterium]|nr:hypothetical protein [Cyclobacteriaceae bacterium]
MMNKQIIIALCEGPHDVAFIMKILKCNGFRSNEGKKIREFPPPMSKLMEQEVAKANVEDLNLREIRHSLLPLNTVQNEECYVFLYSMGGDGKAEARKSILQNIRLNIREPGEIAKGRLPLGTELSILYFFDSDTKGVDMRLTEVRREIQEILTTMPAGAIPTNGSFDLFEGIRIGAYIFTGTDNNTGKLEDVLIPLLKASNETIFENAENYLNTNHDPARIYPLKLSIALNGRVTETRSTRGKETDFDMAKSLIGITGQLQRSGKPNSAYISDSDYLTLAKVIESAKCQDIISFFNRFVSNNQLV